MWWLLVIIPLGSVAESPSRQLAASCPDPKTIQQGPPLPVLPDTFQTTVEVNLVNEGKTVLIEEYFDGPQNKATLKILQDNVKQTTYYDYLNDQIITISNDVCKASKNPHSGLHFYGMDNTPGARFSAPSANDVLRFAKKNGIQYMGQQVVRGILTDQWQSCVPGPEPGSTLSVYFYYTSSSWSTAVNGPAVPVRTEVIELTTPSNSKPIHHILEFVDFRSGILANNSVFQTPVGVVCENRTSTKPVPQAPAAFKYREEMTTNSGSIYNFEIAYDKDKKLSKLFASPSNAWPYDNIINDFNTGVTYNINRTTGKCTFAPISNVSFSAHPIHSENGQQTFRFDTPEELFFLDDTFVFVGKRPCRSRTCDVFSANVTNFPTYENATIEVYFLTNDWTPGTVPVYADIRLQGTNIPVHYTYSVYDFISLPLTMADFDITSCYKDDQKLPIKIAFKKPVNFSEAKNADFLQKTVDQISHVTNLSSIRIQKPHVQVESEKVYFTATLIDVLPPVENVILPKFQMALSQAWNVLRDSVMRLEFTVTTAGVSGQFEAMTATSVSYLRNLWQTTEVTGIPVKDNTESTTFVGR